MITLQKKKYRWNVYISKDEYNYHRRDCGIDTFKSTFLVYAQRHDWKIVASLEHIKEAEKDALFGYYNREQVEGDHLQDLANRLNNGGYVLLDPQEELNKKYEFIKSGLRNFHHHKK